MTIISVRVATGEILSHNYSCDACDFYRLTFKRKFIAKYCGKPETVCVYECNWCQSEMWIRNVVEEED